MPKLCVIAVSTRPGRAGFPRTQWIVERAKAHGGFGVELIDLKEESLPMFDESRHLAFASTSTSTPNVGAPRSTPPTPSFS